MTDWEFTQLRNNRNVNSIWICRLCVSFSRSQQKNAAVKWKFVIYFLCALTHAADEEEIEQSFGFMLRLLGGTTERSGKISLRMLCHLFDSSRIITVTFFPKKQTKEHVQRRHEHRLIELHVATCMKSNLRGMFRGALQTDRSGRVKSAFTFLWNNDLYLSRLPRIKSRLILSRNVGRIFIW